VLLTFFFFCFLTMCSKYREEVQEKGEERIIAERETCTCVLLCILCAVLCSVIVCV